MVKRLTREEYVGKATKLHKGRYTYENTVYTRSAAKIEVTCPNHGAFLVTANNHVSASNLTGCPECYGNKKIPLEVFITKATVIHNGKYSYEKVDLVNSQKHIEIICPEHGSFMQTPTRHISGRGCQICGGTTRQSKQSLIDKAVNIYGDTFDYSQVSNQARATDNVTIVCKLHGPFQQKLKLHINREYGCPQCGQKSKSEAELAEYLSELTVVERRNRTLIKPREIDLWLPNEKIGVEFHGLYWHTEDRVANLHREKWDSTQKIGIRLIQIFEDEWLNKKEIVKSRLAAMLGKGPRVGARSTTVKEIDWSETKDFLNATHIQGAGPSACKRYGLFKQDELLAVGTFAKARTGGMVRDVNNPNWEVLRYASKGSVMGGFSKLFSQFLKDTDASVVVSYCDLRYGNGNLYQATGFKLDYITEPDYWWVPKNKTERVSRYATQKAKLKEPNHPLYQYYDADKSESEICKSAGWKKIYGVGNQKWVWVK
jgi:transcription elongation factor Elf1